MTCDQETLLLISSYVDGETTLEESARAKEHLAACAQCRKMVDVWAEHRELLEWAYTLNIPEIAGFDENATTKAKVGTMPSLMKNIWNRVLKPAPIVWAGALGILLIFVIMAIFSSSSSISIGERIAAGNTVQSARIGHNIYLEIGPHSIVRRIDGKTLRLEDGWIKASVFYGSGLKILTRRLTVLDQGTVFRVGTGKNLDYVIVDEGTVLAHKGTDSSIVTAGKVLLASDKGRPQVVSPPVITDHDKWRKGEPLVQKLPFVPTSAQDLDWQEGLRKFNKKFPELHWGGDMSGGTSTQVNGIEIRSSVGSMLDIKSGIRDHFVDIVQAMAGDRVDSDGWEMQVGFIQTSTILADRNLPGDVYLIRLICKDGGIVWNLTGSSGAELELPFINSFPKDSRRIGSSGSCGEGGGELLKYSHKGWHDMEDFSLKIACWPGDIKPTLNLTLEGVPRTTTQPEIDDLMAQITRQTTKIPGYENSSYGNLLYLDRSRKHEIVICWNKNVDKDMSRLLDNLKQHNGGSVILGAIATNSLLEEPKLPAGVYLLKLIATDNARKPYIELISPNADAINIALRSTPTTRLERKNTDYNSNWGVDMPPGYSAINLCYGVTSAEQGSFSFHFGVEGDPNDPSMLVKKRNNGIDRSNSDKAWAEGYIRVKEP